MDMFLSRVILKFDEFRVIGKLMWGKLLALLLFFLFLSPGSTLQAASYNPDNIPIPRTGIYPMYTSNPDNILSSWCVQHIEDKLLMLEDSAGVKTLVIVVEQLDDDDPQQFSLRVFNQYGIGREKTNRGLVITLATLDKSYYITTGYGLEGELPDAICKRVGYRCLEPHAKEGDWDAAITATVDTIYSILTSDPEVVARFGNDSDDYYDDDMGPIESFFVYLIAFALIAFFSGMALRLVLLLPNLIYSLFHKRKNVRIKEPNWARRFFMNFIASFWKTGNRYYYLDAKGREVDYNPTGIPWVTIMLYLLYILLSGRGGRGGGGGGSFGGGSHGSRGGGRSGGGGAGGRF